MDISFELIHSGYGRTSVGLWSHARNEGVIWAVLDTNDTAYLALASGSNSTEYRYSSAPYLNRWITLRIHVLGSQVSFYADSGSGQQLLQTWPAPISSAPDSYYAAFAVGSISWKSGPNDTTFRRIAVSTPNPPDLEPTSQDEAAKHIQTAKDLLESRDYAGALDETDQAVRIDPQNAQAAALRKQVEQILSILQGSSNIAGSAVDSGAQTRPAQPADANSQIATARQYFEQRQYKLALASCDAALSADPQKLSAAQLREQILKTMRILNIQ
jgi:tetratricopeptide (TPR) repeat protein